MQSETLDAILVYCIIVWHLSKATRTHIHIIKGAEGKT